MACKSEHEVPIGVNRTWVKYIEKGVFPDSRRLFSVMRCNHCDDAPCVEICPVTALFRRNDGIVDFDNRRCIGCKACMQACPYDALYIDPDTHTASKCNYCAHRIDVGLEPACVIVCPTQAIISGDLDDPNSEISKLKSREVVTVRKPEKATLPRLYYINSDRSSLEPAAAGSISSSMWSHQSRGVGHYAHVVEEQVLAMAAKSRAADTGVMEHGMRVLPGLANEPENKDNRLSAKRSPEVVPATVLSKRHPLDEIRDALGLRDPINGVLNPDRTNPKHVVSTSAVQTENARRSYDAPNKGVLWGWQVSTYVWTKAVSAGAGLVAALATFINGPAVTTVEQWVALIVALLFLGVTGILLVMDLDQPKRFLYVMFRPQWKSWLVRGAWIINAYAAVLIIWLGTLVFGTGSELIWIRWILIPTAAMTAIYTAFLFAQARGRDFWQSPLLSIHMLVHCVIAGAAAMSVLSLFFEAEDWAVCLGRILIAAILGKLLIDFLELASTHGTTDSRLVAKMITNGRFQTMYWYGVIGLGCALPLLMLLINLIVLLPVAGLFALLGLYFAEHIWVRAPQLIPLS